MSSEADNVKPHPEENFGLPLKKIPVTMYYQRFMIWNIHGIAGAAGFMLLRWDFAQR